MGLPGSVIVVPPVIVVSIPSGIKSTKALTDIYLSLNPVDLKREIARCQDKLIRLSATKKSSMPHKPGARPKLGRSKRP